MLRDLRREAEREGARVHEPEGFDALARAARSIAERGSDVVVVAGGDGSFMRTLSALARAYGDGPLPPVGLVPGGTVGTVARNLGVGGRDVGLRSLRAACRGEGSHRPVPTLLVRDDAGDAVVGFIAGTGLVARFFDVYHAAHTPGLATAAGIALRVFVGSFVGAPLARDILSPMPLGVTVDGVRQAGAAWSVVVASVLRDVGLHFLVTYRAGQEPGRLHVVASGLSPRRLGPQVLRVVAGRPLVGEPRVDALARSLRLDFAGDGGSYVVDGDVLRARSIVIEPGPVLQLFHP
jgi:diacylglycerol kinase family enzyme